MPAPIPASSDFLAAFPEYAKAPMDLVTSHLAMAARRTNGAAYGDLLIAQDAVFWRAAYTLSISPYSIRANLVDQAQSNQFKRQLYELQRSAVAGDRLF